MTTTEESQSPPRKDRFTLYLVLALVIGGVGFFVAWRRTRDPARMWAARIERDHASMIERGFDRCTGVHTGAELRRLAARVRAGEYPAPLRECHTGPMAELLIAPNSFVSALMDPPTGVDRLRDRERHALLTLSASLRLLEHEVSRARGTPDTATRGAIADRLDELAPDVDREKRAIEDLVTGARDQASLF